MKTFLWIYFVFLSLFDRYLLIINHKLFFNHKTLHFDYFNKTQDFIFYFPAVWSEGQYILMIRGKANNIIVIFIYFL